MNLSQRKNRGLDMSIWQGDKMLAGMPNTNTVKAELQEQYNEFSQEVSTQLADFQEQLGEIDALLDSIIGGS